MSGHQRQPGVTQNQPRGIWLILAIMSEIFQMNLPKGMIQDLTCLEQKTTFTFVYQTFGVKKARGTNER